MTRTASRPLVGLGLALFAACLGAPAQARGNADAGKEVSEVCTACHGPAGISAMEGVPSIGGQQQSFLEWQLVFFRSGRRVSELMSPQAANLSDEDVRNLAAYFASLSPPPKPEADDQPDVSKAGEAIVEEHHCSNCHLDTFLGKQAAARLLDQREDYLKKALADYRSSARPSTGVGAMTEAASTLSDDDIAKVAHFLAYKQ